MSYVEADIMSPEFRRTLLTTGHLEGHPPPDYIHASPPCVLSTKLQGLSGKTVDRNDDVIRKTLLLLQDYQQLRLDGQCTQATPLL